MTGAPCCPDRAGDRGWPWSPHWFAWHEPDGSLDLRNTLKLGGLPSSDAECAQAIADMVWTAGSGLLYGEQTGLWYKWDNSGVYAPKPVSFEKNLAAWTYRAHREVLDRVLELEESLIAQMPERDQTAARQRAKERWARHKAFSARLWNTNGYEALIRMLRSTCIIDMTQMDTGTGEVVADNGRIRYSQVLRDGMVAPAGHDRSVYESRRLGPGVKYDPYAQCPWFELMMRTSVPDDAQRHWLLWRTANALFGRMPRKGFVNLIGERDSGKSTFTEIIKLLAGEYARKVDAKTFLTKHAGDSGFKEADLRGGRFVYTHEPQKGSRFDEELLKTLTGRDTQRTAGKYEKSISWVPQLTVFIGTNSPIRFASSDEAFMDRVEVVRFHRTGPKDEHLPDRLKGELTGIFALLMRYVVTEAQLGMPPLPQSAVDERERMADETENALAFLAAWIEDGMVVVKHDAPAYQCAKIERLYQQYRIWCDEAGEHKIGRKTFAEVIGRRYPRSRSGGAWHFQGLLSTL